MSNIVQFPVKKPTDTESLLYKCAYNNVEKFIELIDSHDAGEITIAEMYAEAQTIAESSY